MNQGYGEHRRLIAEVDQLDEQKKMQFPHVFLHLKSIKKDLAKRRKQRHANDPQYKEWLFETFLAARAMDHFVISNHPEYEQLPDSQKEHRLAKWTDALRGTDAFSSLSNKKEAAQQRLRAAYPQLFVPDAKIKQRQKTAREALKHDPKFQQLSKERAAAWHRQQTYLHEHDSRLSELEKRISESDER